VSVELVLVHSILHGLREIRLQLHRCHRQSVQEQHQIDGVLVFLRIAHLAHDPQPVGLVAGEDVRVHGKGRLELRQRQRGPQPDHLDAMASHIEGTALIELLADAVEEHDFRSLAVVLDKCRPGCGLGRPDPGHNVGGEQSASPIVSRRIAFGVEPAVRRKVIADFSLEADFPVEVHDASFIAPASCPASQSL